MPLLANEGCEGGGGPCGKAWEENMDGDLGSQAAWLNLLLSLPLVLSTECKAQDQQL